MSAIGIEENLVSNQKAAKASLSELYQFATKKDILVLLFAIIITVILSSLPIILILRLGESMKSIQNHSSDLDKFYEEQQINSAIMISLGILSALLGWIASICFIKLGNNLSKSFRNNYFSIVINKPVKWFDKHNPAELGSVINNDCEIIEKALGEKFLIGLSAFLLFFGCWITAFIINFKLTLISIIAMPLQISATVIMQKTSAKETRIYQEKYATSAGIAEENAEGVKTIAACNAQKLKAKSFQNEFESLKHPKLILSAIFGVGAGLMYAIIFALTGVLGYVGAYMMAESPKVNDFTFSGNAVDSILVFFLTALNAVYLGAVVPSFIAFDQARQAAGRINLLVKKNRKFDGNHVPSSINGAIQFKHVSFSYPSNDKMKILVNLSFKIHPGKSLALVGETGCGKSTIIQLLCGFYYPNSGNIKIDDINIRDYNLKSYRAFVSLVSQEPILFNCSIRENIGMGDPDATETDINKACIDSEASEFIHNLPQRSNTVVGVKGCQISGGQKQRIAIARAILKKPKILLLDEATSALDMKTEKKIQTTLKKIIQGKTTIIAAQRLSTIKNADKIAFIKEGRIIESGTFDELMSANGAFHELLGGENKLVTVDNDIDSNDDSGSSLVNSEGNDLAIEKEEVVAKSQGKILLRVLFVLKKYWIWITITLLGSIVIGSTYPIFGYLFAENAFYLLSKSESAAEQMCKENMIYLFILSIVIIFSIIVSFFSISKISLLYSHSLRYQVMSSLLYHDQDYFDTPGNTPASITCRLTSSCDNVSKIGGLVLLLQIISIASIVIGTIISMIYSIYLSLVALGFLPVMIYVFARNEVIGKKGIASKDTALTSEVVSDSLTNIRTVHSLNQQDAFTAKYLISNETENEMSKKNMIINGLVFGFRLSFIYSLRAILAWVGAYLVKSNKISIEDFLIVFYNLSFATWCFSIVGFFTPDIKAGFDSAAALFEIIDNVPEINAESEFGSLSSILGKVEFKNVSFSYKSRDIQVLNQISFKIEAGQRLGITGTTGSGKSTISQLLLRFYYPSSGEILIDDMKIEEYNIKYLRECIGWVGQEPILFRGSILENITLGNHNAQLEKVMEAVNEAQASDIIEKYGFDSDVGLRGNRLSGGQKQRIAIARALVKNPKILVLDESTSALDSNTEKLLQERLQEKQFTIIAISHKLHTIEQFDNIIVIEKGAVIESGTHAELLQIDNGVYFNLFNAI